MRILSADIYNLIHQNHDLYSIIQHDKEIINNDNVIIQQQNQSSLEDKLNNATQMVNILQSQLQPLQNMKTLEEYYMVKVILMIF